MKKEKPLNIGDLLEIEIKGISHQGWGIGRHHGFTVFVPGSLMEERVEVEVQQVKKRFAIARLIKVIRPAAYRIGPSCTSFATCGGCQLQHAHYQHQLQIKRKIIKDALQRIGKFDDVLVHPVLGMGHPWNYRNRCQLHVQVKDGKINIGYFRPESHELVSFEECGLLPDIFNRLRDFLLIELGKYMGNEDIFSLKHIVLIISNDSKDVALILVTSKNKVSFLEDLVRAISKNFQAVISKVQNIQVKNHGSLFGDKWRNIYGQERLKEKIGHLTFSYSPGSFLQVNTEQAHVLYQKIMEYADLKGHEIVLDIYCGIGTISLFLAEGAAQVIGIEEFERAVVDGEYNANVNGFKNTKFLSGKAENILPDLLNEGVKPDLIVVDPPRKGCAPRVLDAIAQAKPKKIIYVSCDPATLARDLKRLAENGYRLMEVQPVDMFPQTGHVECVILMQRSGLKDIK